MPEVLWQCVLEAGINSCRHCFCLWQSTGLQGESFFRQYLEKVRNLKMVQLESRASWKGLCRKGMTLLYVLIAARLDALMGTEYLRDAVCIGFIANEGLSIIENAGLMGLPLPESICQAIDVLKRHSQNTIEKQT